MDPLAGVFDDAQRKKVYNELADAMISAMERGEMLYEEAQESAPFILQRLDQAKTFQELLIFLETLSSKWRAYQPVFIKFQSEMTQKSDLSKISDIEKNLQGITNQ